MCEYDLEHIFSYNVTLHPPEVIGPVPEGARANFYVSDGEATGPKVHGKIHPVGGDWLVVRTDGVAILDVRATIETRDEEALIYVTYTGVGTSAKMGTKGSSGGNSPAASRYAWSRAS